MNMRWRELSQYTSSESCDGESTHSGNFKQLSEMLFYIAVACALLKRRLGSEGHFRDVDAIRRLFSKCYLIFNKRKPCFTRLQ